MKTPIGLVAASTSARNTTICSHPFAVISEPFRPQQRVEQIRSHHTADDDHDRRFQTHLAHLISPVHRSAHMRSTARKTRWSARQTQDQPWILPNLNETSRPKSQLLQRSTDSVLARGPPLRAGPLRP